MNILRGNWATGEMVSLPYSDETLKQNGNKTYKYELPTNCFCLRKAEDYRRGILVAVLGNYSADRILIVGKAPFCKDSKTQGFYDVTYHSYPFPSVEELKEVLAIVRSDTAMQQMLREQHVNIDPAATFWVRDTRRPLFPWWRKPLYYDPQTDSLHTAHSNDERHHRITIVYFLKLDNTIQT